MIFVDASVLAAAVGNAGPERDHAQSVFIRSLETATPLVTSAGVLLEVTAAFAATERFDRVDDTYKLARGRLARIWPLEAEDVFAGGRLRIRYPGLPEVPLARLAACRRHGVGSIHTYDAMLRAASRCGTRGWRRTGRERAEEFQREYAHQQMLERDPQNKPRLG